MKTVAIMLSTVFLNEDVNHGQESMKSNDLQIFNESDNSDDDSDTDNLSLVDDNVNNVAVVNEFDILDTATVTSTSTTIVSEIDNKDDYHINDSNSKTSYSKVTPEKGKIIRTKFFYSHV